MTLNKIGHAPLKRALLLGFAAVAVGCTPVGNPQNIEPVARGDGYQAQYRDPDPRQREQPLLRSEGMNAQKCLPWRGDGGGDAGKGGGLNTVALQGERVSRNDILDVRVGADVDLTGRYVVSRDGALKLPFIRAIPAQGRSVEEIEARLEQELLASGLYETLPPLSVRIADFASVTVGVSGSVFEPHQIEIGGVSGDETDTERQLALGASTEARNLSAALRAVGGVRPDADISAVELRRNGQLHVIDMRGVFEGRNMIDVMLITGDTIFVPSRQCFQDDLMRPSPISPPGVTMFLSNLTQPAQHNANSAIGRDVRQMPYGTRFLQAVVDSNCVGGAKTSSAHRSAALLSRNPETGVSVVMHRDIEAMLDRGDRDDYDPYILPGDALACYDSTVTNIAEVARVLGLVGVALALN
ncbi:polysaccharide biosynthesis/export family protein [Pseudoruegeria sp. SHC-113]|uniref:polysaccharide biosynthesis/export family protein n=1 Tax=Pseudoruegeria sp. SHC-113 TaxID=2855439 RepID=UPI0021BB9110|nr:polysaccharide biosynthesis/export family protein [Pseudoruegeria sp. SHC-113]